MGVTSLSTTPNGTKSLGFENIVVTIIVVLAALIIPFARKIRRRANETTKLGNPPAWVESCKPLFAEKSDPSSFLCFWTHDPHRGSIPWKPAFMLAGADSTRG